MKLYVVTEIRRFARREKIGDEGDEKMPGGLSERREGGDEQQVGRDCVAVRAGCGERLKSFSIFRLTQYFRDLT